MGMRISIGVQDAATESSTKQSVFSVISTWGSIIGPILPVCQWLGP